MITKPEVAQNDSKVKYFHRQNSFYCLVTHSRKQKGSKKKPALCVFGARGEQKCGHEWGQSWLYCGSAKQELVQGSCSSCLVKEPFNCPKGSGSWFKVCLKILPWTIKTLLSLYTHQHKHATVNVHQMLGT